MVHDNTVYFATYVVEEIQTFGGFTPSQKSEINSHNVHSVVVNVQISIKTVSCEIFIGSSFRHLIINYLFIYFEIGV